MSQTIYEGGAKRVHEALSKDCCLIFETIQMLTAGTCCGPENANICTWELFYKMHDAFLEHVEFEERWVFPQLTEGERSLHKAEHERLLCIAAKAKWEFECNYGSQFRDILLEFAIGLRLHHQRDSSLDFVHFLDLDEESYDDRSLREILRRVKIRSLEPLIKSSQ